MKLNIDRDTLLKKIMAEPDGMSCEAGAGSLVPPDPEDVELFSTEPYDTGMIDYANVIATDAENTWNVRDHYKKHSLEDLKLVHAGDRLPYWVCIFNFTGDLNVGTTIRTASLMGAEGVVIFGRRKYDRRSAVGVQNYMRIDRVEGLYSDASGFDLPKFHEAMTERKLMPIYVETEGEPLGTFAWPSILKNFPAEVKPCLVFGNETMGLPTELIRNGFSVRIPMRGVLRSYNVSSAAAIVMWDFVRHYGSV